MSSSSSQRWCRAKPRAISTRAMRSISTARACCSRRSAASTASPAAPIGRGSSSPRRSPCSARRSPRPSTTISSSTPLTSYGAQKAIIELLLADYSRRGFFDGIGCACRRYACAPARPIAPPPASSRRSSANRCQGARRSCRSPRRCGYWCASPRAAVGFFLHAAALDLDRLGPRRNSDDARRFGDGRRADRGVAPRRRRGGGSADPSPVATSRSHASSRDGRAGSTLGALRRSASPRNRVSTRSFSVYLEDDHVPAVA